MNSYNCSYNEGKAVPPLLINSYLAYLTPPADIEPKCDKSYFDIYQLGKKVQYKSKDEEGRKDLSDYEPNARLPTFVLLKVITNVLRYFKPLQNVEK